MNFKRYHEIKNLLDNTAESTSMSNITITVNANKTITLNGVLIASIGYITLGYIDFVKGKEYTISGVTGFTDSTLQIFVESNSAFPLGNRLQCYNGAVTRTARESERCIVRLYMYNTAVYNNVVVSPQINEGSTALPYEPYSSEVWHDIPHYIHDTSTDTLTTLPADIYVNDTTATVGLKGNMEQSGTPTPTDPIQPQECGDLTGNLLNTNDSQEGYITADGSIITSHANLRLTTYIKIPDNTTNLTQSCETGYAMNTPAMCFFNANKEYISGAAFENAIEKTFIVPNNTVYIRTCYRTTSPWNMLNIGSTALPYEPWGIKIPISSANTTTPVYLGEVQTTRMIKKLVLTGEETTWRITGSGRIAVRVGAGAIPDNATCICTHFKGTDVTAFIRIDVGECSAQLSGVGGYREIGFYSDTYTTVEPFQNFVRQQYAAGTPVTVWYVLVTPTTAIVNEPLRKIGNYADEVSGITIPTIAGANILSVDTTVQPSEVTATYKGWHPVADVHERENSAWD